MYLAIRWSHRRVSSSSVTMTSLILTRFWFYTFIAAACTYEGVKTDPAADFVGSCTLGVWAEAEKTMLGLSIWSRLGLSDLSFQLCRESFAPSSLRSWDWWTVVWSLLFNISITHFNLFNRSQYLVLTVFETLSLALVPNVLREAVLWVGFFGSARLS